MKKMLVLLAFLVALWIAVSVAARHGYLAPGYGSVLNLFSPPNDIWVPLASKQLRQGVRNYEMIVSHKYPGNHEVLISIPRQRGMESLPTELTVILEIEQEGRVLTKREESGNPFWGVDRQGASFCRYSFPADVSLRENVVCRVMIEGDSDLLLDRYGDVVVSIVKGSDK